MYVYIIYNVMGYYTARYHLGVYVMYVYICIYIYIYPHACVSSFSGLISVARVNEYRTADVTIVLKAPGAELCQNADP